MVFSARTRPLDPRQRKSTVLATPALKVSTPESASYSKVMPVGLLRQRGENIRNASMT